jgi:hypothetical protein
MLIHVLFSVYQTTHFQWFSFEIMFTATVSHFQLNVQHMATTAITTLTIQGEMYKL